MYIRKILKSKFAIMVGVQFGIVVSGLFAKTGSDKFNSWIDLPIIETIEYFTTLMAQGLNWAWKYGSLFGVIGLVWSALKVQMNRMKPMQLVWDTTFKWGLFLALVWMYPSITYGFLGVATEIGEKAGMGKSLVEQDMKKLYNQAKNNKERAKKLEKMTYDIADATGRKPTTTLSMHDSYATFMQKVTSEIKGEDGIPFFDSKRDLEKAQGIVDQYTSDMQEDTSFWLSGITLKALESVCTEKNLDGSGGTDLLDSYIQLQIYLVDKNGEDTMFISPAAMIRLSILCGLVMWDRWNYQYTKESEEISGNFITKPAKDMGHFISAFPQIIELLFCQFVLIFAIGFAMIQYVMTIIEFVIVTAIAAIFLPLMLFDGTKDIPKKFIPLMISHMMKITCMIICMYFVMYLLTEHTMNVITESWGVNLFAVAEIFFVAALCYVLTQNGPKVAQAIMTGQPQLSMGEALAGAGTALATPATAKQMATAPFRGAARLANKGADIAGGIAKHHAASKAAVEALGENATGKQKFKAMAKAHGAVARQDLKDRMHAKWEQAGQSSGTGISILDRAMQQAGFGPSGGSGGSGGGAGGSFAYRQVGQGKVGQTLTNTSNANFKTATKYDEKTQSQRHMTDKEFLDEKRQQGRNIVFQMLERENAKKAENPGGGSDNALPDSLTDNNRPTE